jgi:hypothetical protein
MAWPKDRRVSREFVEAVAEELGGDTTATRALEEVMEQGIENPEFYEDKAGIHLKREED